MKEDIERPVVTDVAMAAVKEKNEFGEDQWMVYLVNMRDIALGTVLVASKGYGEIDGENRETSILRHHLDTLPPKSFARIEPIMKEVFGMFNEYWLSFFAEGKMYDKKYIFVPEAISEDNYTRIPLMDVEGVMIG